MHASVRLPAGYRVAAFDRLDSTNAEAMRRAGDGDPGKLWVWAVTQSAGRGRAGRHWESPVGNLHASLLLRPACGLDVALQLAFVAGLAAYDAVVEAVGDRRRLRLKWPNDLLLDGGKLGGVLLESAVGGRNSDLAVVVGIGLNLAAHPSDALRPATDLSMLGFEVSPRAMLERLAETTNLWLSVWDEGRDFAAVRSAWETRALDVGHPIRVRLEGGEEEGSYGGIDAAGALRLLTRGGVERRITAGDVFAA